MDELSPIFQDIEFRVTLRGYDVDQVDAYIDRVAKSAALVQGRLGELQARAEAAESRLTPDDHSDPEASLSRTLILAQRTADAAVAEAREESAKILAEAHEARSVLAAELEADSAAARRAADDYASRVRAEADTDRRRLLADAESAAAAAATGERDRLAEEVAELEQYRAFLNDDVAILETHLLDQRAALAASVSALTDLVQSPEGFRVVPAPATSGAVLDLSDSAPNIEPATATIAADPIADEPVDLIADEPVDLIADEPVDLIADEPVAEEPVAEEPVAEERVLEARSVDEPAGQEPATEIDVAPVAADSALVPRTPDEVSFDEWAEPAAIDLTVDPEPAAPNKFFEDFERTGEFAVVDTTRSHAAPGSTDTGPTDTGPTDMGEATVVTAPPVLATAADFDAETDPVATVAENADAMLFQEPAELPSVDPFLQQIREAAADSEPSDFGDDALSAFFDHDDSDGERGWFGRRR